MGWTVCVRVVVNMSARASLNTPCHYHQPRGGLSVGGPALSSPGPLLSPPSLPVLTRDTPRPSSLVACHHCPLEGLSVDRWAVHCITRHPQKEVACPLCASDTSDTDLLSTDELRTHLSEEHGLRLPPVSRRDRGGQNAGGFFLIGYVVSCSLSSLHLSVLTLAG